MSKLDEVKEILNTLRVVLTIVVGLEALLIGGLINRTDAGKNDIWAWVGVVVVVLLTIAIGIVSKLIAKRTKEIKDL